MAWGVGCAEGLPAIYSSVPDAMCWIDSVMTCQPLANQDVYERQEVTEKRTSSINNLTSSDCADWRSKHTNCGITYGDEEQDAEYDLRKGPTDNEYYDGIFDYE